jgi:putative membrane protein
VLFVLTLIVAALLAVFMVQNAGSVELHFLLWSVAMSQALLVFFVLAAGMLIGWTAHAYIAFRRRHRKTVQSPEKPSE